jgi:predicted amidophosphoribosyltransferase
MNSFGPTGQSQEEIVRRVLPITGECFSGWALEQHLVYDRTRSKQPTTRRSELGDRLYRFRHQGENGLLDGLVQEFSAGIEAFFDKGAARFNLLVAVPAPVGRYDYESVVAFVTALSGKTGIASAQFAVAASGEHEKGECDEKTISARTFWFSSPQVKNIFRDKSVLVVDDLYRSGRSLHLFCRFLKNKGCAASVGVIVGTLMKGPLGGDRVVFINK